MFQVPAYLATSPITPSSLSQMEAGLAALKAASADVSIGQDDALTPVVEHSGTIVTMEDGKVVVSAIPPSATMLSVTVEDERQYFSDSEVPFGSCTGRRRRQNVSVATQTHLTASDVDYIRTECCTTPPGEWYSKLSSTNGDISREGSSESALQGCNVPVADSSSMERYASSELLIDSMAKPDWSTGSAEKNMLSQTTADDCQFYLDMSDDDVSHGTLMQSLLGDTSAFARCASMPSISQQTDKSTDAWAANQYISTAMNDYTPTARYHTLSAPVHLC